MSAMEQPAINEAGLLNSMSVDDLKVTCERLERSCEDMRSLLNEFVEEQAMLRREQDRLHKRVEKAQKKVGRSQENFIDNLISDMEHLEVSNLLSSIFRAKEERKVAKRRRWTTKETPGKATPLVENQKDQEDGGPFSDNTVSLSWATELHSDRLPEPELAGHGADALSRWVREVMSGDPVAEERLPDGWAQLARAAETSPNRPSPGSSPTGLGFFDANSPRAMRPVQRAQRPDFGPDGQDLEQTAEESHFDTLVGLVSNVAGHQVAQQMERGFEAAQQLAQQAQRAASKRMDRGEIPAQPSFSRRLQEAGAVIASFSFTDWATGTAEEGDEGDKPRLESEDANRQDGRQESTTSIVFDRKTRRAKFQEEFSMYISKTADSPERPRAARPPVSVAPPRAAFPSSEDEPPTPPPQPPSREAVLLALQSEDDAVEEAPEVCSVPYGVVAQVTSLISGAVRLSWLFDWEAAPIISEAQRGFEVLWCEVDGEENITTQYVERSPSSLDLPLGSRCRLQVKAVLKGPDATSLWSSNLSAAVSADLRCERRPEGKATPSEPSSPAADSNSVVTPMSTGTASFVPKPKGRVAANFTEFLKRTPPAASAAKTNAKVVMGGSAPKASVLPTGPLGSLQPRVIQAGPLDPTTEKRELQERIRLRSQPGGVTAQAHDDRPRSSSFDSDDESLAKLSQALSSLEKTQQALQKRQLEVANEGPHSLARRMAPDNAA